MAKRFLGDKLDIEIERFAKCEIIIKTINIDKERLTKEKEILQRTALDFEKVIKSQRNDIDLWLKQKQRADAEDLLKAKASELSSIAELPQKRVSAISNSSETLKIKDLNKNINIRVEECESRDLGIDEIGTSKANKIIRNYQEEIRL